MNEPEFEKELRHVRPAALSETLKTRIAADLAAPVMSSGILPGSRRAAVLSRLAWACFGAAVALAVTTPWKNPPAAAATKFEPAGSDFEISDRSREIITATDEGLLYLTETEPQRRLRVSYLERQTWTNPGTGAVIAYETPRDGVLLIPVAVQ